MTLKSEPLHLADGCLITATSRGGWHFAPLLGWYDSLFQIRTLGGGGGGNGTQPPSPRNG